MERAGEGRTRFASDLHEAVDEEIHLLLRQPEEDKEGTVGARDARMRGGRAAAAEGRRAGARGRGGDMAHPASKLLLLMPLTIDARSASFFSITGI